MSFDPKAFIAEQTEAIRKTVTGKAIIACSGGVDSTAAAVLASRALSDRLLAVYVDTGLMRKDETKDVERTLDELHVNHRILRAANEFFAALKGITDPEKKRMIIGGKFIELFEREAETFGADHLVQGTIAPDWITCTPFSPITGRNSIMVPNILQTAGESLAVEAQTS